MKRTPPKQVDKSLFKNTPSAIQELNKRARKEQRQKERSEFKADHGIGRQR